MPAPCDIYASTNTIKNELESSKLLIEINNQLSK